MRGQLGGCRPDGATGLASLWNRRFFQSGGRIDLSDCLVDRQQPWLLEIWEPIRTKAPSPTVAQPYCCYIQTVVFYHRPYIVRPWTRISKWNGRYRAGSRGEFEVWDQIETRLTFDDRVTFEGEEFNMEGGRVRWARRRWWMQHRARRVTTAAA